MTIHIKLKVKMSIISFLKHLFKLQFLIILLSILTGLYYPQIKEKLSDCVSEYVWIPKTFTNVKPISTQNLKTAAQTESQLKKELLFTKDILAEHNGLDGKKPIYLSILGNVYDVSKGRKHYGVGCSYNSFAGRDASANFISGNFESNDDCDDVLQLSNSDLYSLANWKLFYDKEYTYMGKLIGRFYDENGEKTNYCHQYDQMVKIAEIEKEDALKNKEKYPPCNIEWSAEKGTRVWCTSKSGGKDRGWIGWPRQYYESPGKSFKCTCVQEEYLNQPQFKLYKNCDPKSTECYFIAEN